MGYQIGNRCFETKELAENHHFSQVPPVITAEGLKVVSYSEQHKSWFYGSQQLSLSLPKCEPHKNLIEGYEFGFSLLPTAILLFMTSLIIKLMK